MHDAWTLQQTKPGLYYQCSYIHTNCIIQLNSLTVTCYSKQWLSKWSRWTTGDRPEICSSPKILPQNSW